MATNLPNMGLRVWDQSGDFYSHGDLVNNFTAIDNHAHIAGQGVQIPTGGIVNNAITQAKLANLSVGTAQLIDGSVTASKLAAGTTLPLRSVIPWWRENSGVAVPSMYAICDGTLWNAIPNDMALSVGSIPDLRNKFILGAATSGTGSGTGTPPAINASGGAHSSNLDHVHPVTAHTHNVVIPAHTHTISGDGAHSHQFDVVSASIHYQVDLQSQNLSLASGATNVNWATFGGSGITSSNGAAPLVTSGTHNHSGATGSGGNTTVASNPDSGSTTGNPTSTLSATDIRPGFVGLLYIMRVKLT